MYFHRQLATTFCCFLNSMMKLKNTLPAVNLQSHTLKILDLQMICMSLEYFPLLISVIRLAVPKSAFNSMEITIELIKEIQPFTNVFFQTIFCRLVTIFQLIVTWALWTSIVPVIQLIVGASMIFPFTSLKHTTFLLYE